MPDNDKKKSSAIWEAFLRGDDSAFAALYFLHINRLLAYGRKFTRDSELLHDCIQEVFVDIYEKRTKEQTRIDNPGAYLLVSLRNAIFKKKERSRKSELHGMSPMQIDEFNIEYSFQDSLILREFNFEVIEKLRTAIRNLSPGQKEIIFLKFEEGLPYTEIARILQITVESARKQVYRAVISLRKILDSKNLVTLVVIFSKKQQN